VKSCEYCGRENEDAAQFCVDCRTPFAAPTIQQPRLRPETQVSLKIIDPQAIADAFSIAEGFTRAEWETVAGWITQNVSSANCESAWNEAVLLWVSKLREDLGGSYYYIESPEIILLCDLDLKIAEWLLDYSNRASITIRHALGDIAWAGAMGKNVVLVFSDVDDYYQYIALHCREGEQAASAGICVHSGYTHIALPWHDETEAAGTIVHELAHDSLAHLRLPLWLNEGVAETLARAVAPPRPSVSQSIQDSLFASAIGWKPPIIWDELAERHFGWWDSDRIQAFWAGTSFYEPGDASELSYSLAEVLVNLASEKANPESFRGCLNAALQEDAGRDAFQQILGLDLGELAGKFLGPGKWRPERLCMKRLWQAAGWINSGKS
jgi:hypothetical protein